MPVKKLLSDNYAGELAVKVRSAVKDKKALAISVEPPHEQGTTNICSVDRHGNAVAMTLTHGNPFGAQVTVDGLGLTLGHGMSRFEPNPRHPNAPGPGKRPLMGVSPSLVLRKGIPVMAVGAGGGVKIPNCLFDVLTQFVLQEASMESAVAAQRLHTTGTLSVAVEPHFPKETAQYLTGVGFKVQTSESSAIVSAVSFNPGNGECRGAIRGGLLTSSSVPSAGIRSRLALTLDAVHCASLSGLSRVATVPPQEKPIAAC